MRPPMQIVIDLSLSLERCPPGHCSVSESSLLKVGVVAALAAAAAALCSSTVIENDEISGNEKRKKGTPSHNLGPKGPSLSIYCCNLCIFAATSWVFGGSSASLSEIVILS